MYVLENRNIEEKIKLKLHEVIKLFKADVKRKNMPLDGDEVEILAKWLWLLIDYNEGNMTQQEYEDSTGNLNWEIF